jgi:hypothetical protein
MKQIERLWKRGKTLLIPKQETTISPTVSATIVANKQASSNSSNNVSNATEALAAPSQQDLEAKLLLNKDRKQRETENKQNGLVFYQKLEEEREREREKKNKNETQEQRRARIKEDAMAFVAKNGSIFPQRYLFSFQKKLNKYMLYLGLVSCTCSFPAPLPFQNVLP